MAVNSKHMSFRNERAQELRQMITLIEKVIGGNLSTHNVHSAISQLQDKDFIPVLKDGSTDESIWGYDIEEFSLPLDVIKHVKPNDINNGEVVLTLKLRACIKNWNTFVDPFIELGFNVMLKGIGKKVYHFGFHIDKHTETKKTDEPHPVYHLQYNFNPTKSESPNLGDLFYIDTPRIMHKPLDFILGIGFLTSNFYPIAFETLCQEREFHKLNQKYQEAFWKPYFHTLANKWKPFDQSNIVWNPINEICPIFI